MKWTLLYVLVLSSFSGFAQEICDEDKEDGLKPIMEVAAIAQEQATCPNPKKIKNICMTIDGRMKDSSPTEHTHYLFQRKIIEAACVDLSKDNQETISKKIQKTWKDLEKQMVCNGLNFDVVNGSIVKYAVNTKFDDFIDVVADWKVDLNKIDESDKRTVLDYVKYHMERNKGTEVETRLKSYYETLRKAGAKHKSEL